MILADTSAWVEYDRASGSEVDRRMVELVEGAAPLAVTEPVVMEIVAGARTDARELQLRRLLRRFELLEFDGRVDCDGAASIYRTCRRAGVTPRSLVDCLIASVAARHGATLLAADADLVRVARVMGIEVDGPSWGPC